MSSAKHRGAAYLPWAFTEHGAIETALIGHDGALRDIYEKLRPLLLPAPETSKRRIGFRTQPE
jgi:hypothetical protein